MHTPAEHLQTVQSPTEKPPDNSPIPSLDRSEQARQWYRKALSLFQSQKIKEALHFAQLALDTEPNHPPHRLLVAHCQLHQGLLNHAMAHARQLFKGLSSSNTCSNLNAIELDALGHLFSRIGDFRSSYTCFKEAHQRAPDNAKYAYNYAMACRTHGHLKQAEQLLDKTLLLTPDDWECYLTRSQLRRQTRDNNHIEQLQQLLRDNKQPAAAIQLAHALAKEYEDIGNYPSSFSALKRAADLRRRHSGYKVSGEVKTLEAIRHSYDKYKVHQSGGYDNDEAIFILGLPRTGTTLVERIVSNHSKVISAGELHNFSNQLVQLTEQEFGRSDKLTLVRHSSALPAKRLGQGYIDSTRALTGKNPHFIDKMPLNYLYMGAIHRALPKAKIIHLTRNPMDACYAIYKTLFKQTYPFSYDLGDLANYYIAYRKLISHWQATLGDAVLWISYEALVHQQETVSRQLLDYCQLEWEPACLDFHTNTQPSATASASQVRQRIHKNSVGKWKEYRTELAPLYRALTDADIDPERW